MTADSPGRGHRAQFLAELRTAFHEQSLGVDGRGAVVTEVREVSHGEPDFAIEARFHAGPSGPEMIDTIHNVNSYMAGCGAESAAELAAFWMQELDESVLSDPRGDG